MSVPNIALKLGGNRLKELTATVSNLLSFSGASEHNLKIGLERIILHRNGKFPFQKKPLFIDFEITHWIILKETKDVIFKVNVEGQEHYLVAAQEDNTGRTIGDAEELAEAGIPWFALPFPIKSSAIKTTIWDDGTGIEDSEGVKSGRESHVRNMSGSDSRGRRNVNL